jgi:CdiA C-terminal tRNase domain
VVAVWALAEVLAAGAAAAEAEAAAAAVEGVGEAGVVADSAAADAAGTEAAGSEAAGSEAAGSEAAGSEAAGTESSGAPASARELGVDPATGTFRQAEYETASRVQTERGIELFRSADPAVDWVDAQGNTYDAVGNFGSQHFDQQWPNLQARIIDHLAKADYVPVDVSRFTPDQVALVRDFVDRLGPSVFIVGGL